MKKILALLLVFSALLVGCAGNTKKETKKEVKKEMEAIKVAAHTNPMTTMLKLIEPDLKEKGYKLELVSVTDNVQANVALNNKEVDANFFQHEPFMAQFNDKNKANLVKVTPVYNALVAFYSKTAKSLDELKDGAVVAIPNDPTNKARALRLLASSKLIELKDPNSYKVTVEDVVKNPKNLQFKEWGLLNLNEAYQESDLTFNYPTYIEALKLKPLENGLILEPEADKTFAIIIAAREDNKESEKIKVLKELMNGEKIKNFIDQKLKGHARVAF
ncbi:MULTISPECIES: MetQ/NlpA family ABC transporter substrate-binding protein [Helcococcus]|uniref:MetQ/NlpA family ABC transporter substrate-binding protein n=1 Tax=Helcococcus bovis TaxID=3153252 RepID=A0ABW9F4A9_9FIRM